LRAEDLYTPKAELEQRDTSCWAAS